MWVEPMGGHLPPVSPMKLKFSEGKEEVKRILTPQIVPLDDEFLDDGERNPRMLRDSPHARKLWTPFFLTKTVLIGFIFVFAAAVAALVVLNLQSHKPTGLLQVDPKNHYLWSFAPTASQFYNPLLRTTEANL
jgi:hypothetical protein